MTHRIAFCLVLALACSVHFAGCRGRAGLKTQRADKSGVGELAGVLAGTYSSAEQAAQDGEYQDIRLHMAPIWADRRVKNERWLYVEQSLATSLDKPYRQRVYRLSARGNSGEYVSEVFELPGEAMLFAGAWRNPDSFRNVSPSDLTRREGCDVVLRRESPGVYEGGTQGNGCAGGVQGAAYATSEVHADAEAILTWDRGFDAQGTQVWGSRQGPYRFRRLVPPR